VRDVAVEGDEGGGRAGGEVDRVEHRSFVDVREAGRSRSLGAVLERHAERRELDRPLPGVEVTPTGDLRPRIDQVAQGAVDVGGAVRAVEVERHIVLGEEPGVGEGARVGFVGATRAVQDDVGEELLVAQRDRVVVVLPAVDRIEERVSVVDVDVRRLAERPGR
jgi:hypothetical protein